MASRCTIPTDAIDNFLRIIDLGLVHERNTHTVGVRAYPGESIAIATFVFKAKQRSETDRSRPGRSPGIVLSSAFPSVSNAIGISIRLAVSRRWIF